MVYEIYYEPKGNIWRIRIITYYMLFFSVSRIVCEAVKDNGKAKFDPMNFPTCKAAEDHAVSVGLEGAYIRRLRNGNMSTWLNGVATHATSS